MKTTKKNKNRKRPKQKWKTNQSTKINLIGCDTIVNSPSSFNIVTIHKSECTMKCVHITSHSSNFLKLLKSSFYFV